eukprot:NODE_3981_length_854_cov_25.166460_g3303_i0.p1 GENE.NODE_3981_length_854_cov_25.166460_g3303_i0~~NODE_3981_length_854_cov_25.166460_g3303_i0.p1  ORF type:complete len:269 (-),score=45.35 NODE_3981_length_854_cov_25.166460_g3303_i0:47-742(-)
MKDQEWSRLAIESLFLEGLQEIEPLQRQYELQRMHQFHRAARPQSSPAGLPNVNHKMRDLPPHLLPPAPHPGIVNLFSGKSAPMFPPSPVPASHHPGRPSSAVPSLPGLSPISTLQVLHKDPEFQHWERSALSIQKAWRGHRGRQRAWYMRRVKESDRILRDQQWRDSVATRLQPGGYYGAHPGYQYQTAPQNSYNPQHPTLYPPTYVGGQPGPLFPSNPMQLPAAALRSM